MRLETSHGAVRAGEHGYPVRVAKDARVETLLEHVRDFSPAILINDLPSLESAYLTALSHLGATTVNLVGTVGGEPGVEIIYDRRPPPRNPGTLRRLASRVKRAFGLSRRDQALEALGRRQRTRIDQDLKANGWAVVRLDDPHDA